MSNQQEGAIVISREGTDFCNNNKKMHDVVVSSTDRVQYLHTKVI